MTDLRTAAQQALEALKAGPDVDPIFAGETEDALRAALAEPVQEQDIEDAIEAAYWHFDARKQGLNEWASAPQSERDAFKAEARKLVRGYFPTRQAQDTKREMLAVADAFIRGKRAALAEPDLFHCPQCGGPADNGHDRSIPPNPYFCTKCMAEPHTGVTLKPVLYANRRLTNEEIDAIVGRPKAEPVEPIAWYHVPYPNNGAAPMVSLSKQHEPSMYGAVVPLFLGAPYDQTSLELCEVCGWKTLIPGDCCLNCARINCASLQDQNTELDKKLAEMEAKLNNPSVDDAFRILAEANRRAIDYINELEAERNALKAADKQRKPLNEFDALRLITSTVGLLQSAGPVEGLVGIIRAVERAHGIKE